jgi:hypothetical protein
MFVCEWHIDIPFGRQSEAIEILKAWNLTKFEHTEFRRVRSHRLLIGHVGVSPSHIIDSYVFETLSDFDAALKSLSHSLLKQHSDAIAPLIVPGSQHWRVYRIVEEQR